MWYHINKITVSVIHKGVKISVKLLHYLFLATPDYINDATSLTKEAKNRNYHRFETFVAVIRGSTGMS